MSIKEKIENHLFVTLTVVAVASGGVAGSTVFWLMGERINNITTRFEAEIAVLKRDSDAKIRELENKTKIEGTSTEKSESFKELEAQTSPAEPQNVEYGQILSEGNPFPKDFDQFKLGTPISVLPSVYPTGEFDSFLFRVKPANGPFAHIAFYFDSFGNDPEVTSVSFFYRDKKAKEQVRVQAIQAFKTTPVTSELLGRVLTWRINQVEVVVSEESYSLKKLRQSLTAQEKK